MSEWEISKRKLLCLQERKLEYQWATKKVNTHKKKLNVYTEINCFSFRKLHIGVAILVFRFEILFLSGEPDGARAKATRVEKSNVKLMRFVKLNLGVCIYSIVALAITFHFGNRSIPHSRTHARTHTRNAHSQW